MKEANKAGIRLRPGAAQMAALVLSHDGNSVNLAGQTFAIAQKSDAAVCRMALARAVRLDERVKISRTDPKETCRAIGTVAGAEHGKMGEEPGSVDASITAAQFAALAHGANLLIPERSESSYSQGGWGNLTVRTTGRAFVCSDLPAPTSLSPTPSNSTP